MKYSIIISLLFLLGFQYDSEAQSIKDLDFLIGKWQLKEVVHKGEANEYTERGIRECKYILDETYIHCDSKATRKGKSRSYIMNINYNTKTKRFFMTDQFSDFDFRGNSEIILDSVGQELHLISPLDVDDGEFFRSRISFKDRNKLIWEGWSSPFLGERVWNLLYTEEMTRKK
ncbi:MAG: DUF1579 family protein [Roseivirga sp.]|nr:DUF1579 family protein [Roseivirga sp.]